MKHCAAECAEYVQCSAYDKTMAGYRSFYRFPLNCCGCTRVLLTSVLFQCMAEAANPGDAHTIAGRNTVKQGAAADLMITAGSLRWQGASGGKRRTCRRKPAVFAMLAGPEASRMIVSPTQAVRLL